MTNTKKIRDEIIRKIKSKDNREVLGNWLIYFRNHYKESCARVAKYWTGNQLANSGKNDFGHETDYHFTKADNKWKQYWRPN